MNIYRCVFATLVLIHCSLNLFSQVINSYKPDFSTPKRIEGYTLVWQEEFNYIGKPDQKKWSYETGFKRNHELQWYHEDNAHCKDGVLIIEGRRDTIINSKFSKNSSNWRLNRPKAFYSSASINTNYKASWKYGRFEIRARIDSTKGSWPAIWTLGKTRYWPANGEIDIMEFYIKNSKQSILANAAWLGLENKVKWNSKVISLSKFLNEDSNWLKKFHVWRMDWNKKHIKLYIDNILVNTISLSYVSNPDGYNPFHQEHYLLLNLAIGANGDNPQKSKFPISYEVDYVRVYQKDK